MKNSWCRQILSTALLALLFLDAQGQPKISLSFDDGKVGDFPGYTLHDWNDMLLDKLDRHDLRSVLFVAGFNKSGQRGRYVVKSWNDSGHLIANHTMNHPNYNVDDISISKFKAELLSNDSLIRSYPNYTKLFRFPYLKEGNTPDKVESIRSFMAELGYRNGYVTIDASDWYLDMRLVERLRERPDADISGFRDFYLEHIWDRAQFYEKLSYELNGRHIAHTLLLHHNLAAALFIDDLIEMFKEKGWEIVSSEQAYSDPIYEKSPDYAGESLIYALAKDSGEYEDILRYPAEDARYEKKRMNRLGL